MTVRFFSYFYAPCIGGGEVILQHQAEELARRGWEVHVHTTPFTNLNLSSRGAVGSTVEGGVHVHRRWSFALPFHNPYEKDAVTPAFIADVAAPADLLVCVGFPSIHLDLLVPYARARRIPLVAQNYITAEFLDEILAGVGGWNKRVRSRYWQTITRRQLAAVNLLIADSPAAARALEARLGLSNVGCHIGMAVDPREFDVAPSEGSAVRARLGLGASHIVLAPSRLSRQKGADLLLNAITPLLQGPDQVADDWTVVIAGPVNDPEFAEEVRALAAPLHGRAVITALPRHELCALLLETDIVVLPSRGETVGGVIFEAMYAGALAIVSDAVEAAREVYLQDGENGLLVPSEDVFALRTALRRAMTTDTTRMRQRGRAMVEETYTWSRSVDRLMGLYARALPAGQG